MHRIKYNFSKSSSVFYHFYRKCTNAIPERSGLIIIGGVPCFSIPYLMPTVFCDKDHFKYDDVLNFARKRDEFNLKRLIDENKDINVRHELGWNTLHSAAMNSDRETVRLLLENGADPNVRDEFSTPTKISKKLKLNQISVRLQRRSEFSQLNEGFSATGFTPLHYAVLADDAYIINLLLKHGANPSLSNEMGHTPYDYTESDVIQKLLKKYEEKFVEDEKERQKQLRILFPLEKRLKDDIIGQESAIMTVSAAVRRKECGWHDEEHPLVFLFLGSSGIATVFHISEQTNPYFFSRWQTTSVGSINFVGFIRMDMSEYQEKHEVAKFIGSPPGYVGHDEGGQLTNLLKKNPNAVVLFDEVDTAHPDVLTVMLQLFDEGRLTDSRGETINCKNAIFIMTSNLAQDEISEYAIKLRRESKRLAKERYDDPVDEKIIENVSVSRNFKDRVIRPILKYHFKREAFLGRINEIVYFLPFSKSEIQELVKKELRRWSKQAKNKHNITLEWDENVLDVLADGYDIHYGARSLKYEVDRRVICKLALAHERNLIKAGSSVLITMDSKLSNSKENLSSGNAVPKLKFQIKNSNNHNYSDLNLDEIEQTLITA